MPAMRSISISFALLFFAFASCGDNANTTPKVDASVDAPGGTPSCADYCTKVMANCTDTNKQYDNMADCTNSCQHFMLGTLGMMMMNTVGCRTYHAEAAKANPGTHCEHAGPSGAGQCGNVCGAYCKIAEAACPSQVGTTCSADCSSYAKVTDKPYSIAIQSGNTAECRLYHATRAVTDPDPHCMHVGNASSTCK
jgi:hypothetical protein